MKTKTLNQESFGYLGWLRYKKVKIKLNHHAKSNGGILYSVIEESFYVQKHAQRAEEKYRKLLEKHRQRKEEADGNKSNETR